MPIIKKSGYIGSLVWELGDYRLAQLKDIPNHVELIKGDTIVTSGYSSVYPEGVIVGVVKEFDFSPKLVFARWEKFMERVRIIQDLFQTAAEFLRLEKVEIGGLTRKINANDYDIYFIIYVFLTFFFLNYRSERENA